MIVKKAASIATAQAPADYFTGTVWLNALVANDGIAYNIASVTFTPGARNYWHTHPHGQVLIATAGKGYVQKKGEAIQVLEAGDVAIIPAGEVHWHGAAPDSLFTHLAIQTPPALGPVTEWGEEVTDAQYHGA